MTAVEHPERRRTGRESQQGAKRLQERATAGADLQVAAELVDWRGGVPAPYEARI